MKSVLWFLAFVLIAAPCEAAASNSQVTITGVVRAAEKTSRGEPIRVYIDAKEEPILLSRQEKGKELLQQVGATVRVTGDLRKVHNNENFTKVIYVTAYVVEKVAPPKPPRVRE